MRVCVCVRAHASICPRDACPTLLHLVDLLGSRLRALLQRHVVGALVIVSVHLIQQECPDIAPQQALGRWPREPIFPWTLAINPPLKQCVAGPVI